MKSPTGRPAIRIHVRRQGYQKVHFLKKSVALLASLFFLVGAAACARKQTYPSPPQTGDAVVIEIKGLPIGKPQFYTYRGGNGRINFFVVRTKEKVMAFLDACSKCYAKKRGYACTDDAVICRACEVSYPVASLEKGMGSCMPIGLESEVSGGKLIIRGAMLRAMIGKY